VPTFGRKRTIIGCGFVSIPLANPRSNEALAKLCETFNALEIRYPGTELKSVYQAPGVA
jgi:hypothetical protein